MSMGIIGIGAQFMQAGCAKGKKEQLSFIPKNAVNRLTFSNVGVCKITHTVSGQQMTTTVPDGTHEQFSINADAGTDIIMNGIVTKLQLMGSGPSNPIISIDTTMAASIEYLRVGGEITSLDLSNNTKLQTLNCNSCTGITSLDLSNNTELQTLNCSDCTGITSLDLSNNTKLQTLNCNSCTGITSLDLSNNTELQTLNCANNNLKVLNIENCVNLESISYYEPPQETKAIEEIYYPATNSNVSTRIAALITAATADDGTVYTDSAAAYYSTIATAATTKGWTIEQLQ